MFFNTETNYRRQGECFRRCLFVCLFVSTLRKNFRTDLHEIFREGWQWASEQMNKFWWRSGLPSGYRDCFPDSSLLRQKESGMNRLRCATLQCTAGHSRHHHSNCDVITPPALGGGALSQCFLSGVFIYLASENYTVTLISRHVKILHGLFGGLWDLGPYARVCRARWIKRPCLV